MEIKMIMRVVVSAASLALLAGCVEQQGLSQPTSSEAGASYLERQARNHLVCMSAYSAAISPCTDIASNQRAADKTNQELSEIAEDMSLSDEFFNTVTADDYGEACVGKRTDEVFGDADAATNAPSGSGSLPSGNSPEEVYDWAADGLSEEVQSVLDRIYAKPDVEAPDWLKRPVGRMFGHRKRAQALLKRDGFTQEQAKSIINQYGVDSSYSLTGNHPEDQDTIYKAKACLEIL